MALRAPENRCRSATPPEARFQEKTDASNHHDPSEELAIPHPMELTRPAPGTIPTGIRTLSSPIAVAQAAAFYSSNSQNRTPVPPMLRFPSESTAPIHSGIHILDSSGTLTSRDPPAPSLVNPQSPPAGHTHPHSNSASATASGFATLPRPPGLHTRDPQVPRGMYPRVPGRLRFPSRIAQGVNAATADLGISINPAAIKRPDSDPTAAIGARTTLPEFVSGRRLPTQARMQEMHTGHMSGVAPRLIMTAGYTNPAPMGSKPCPVASDMQPIGVSGIDFPLVEPGAYARCVECTTHPEDPKHPFEVVVWMPRRRRADIVSSDSGSARGDTDIVLAAGAGDFSDPGPRLKRQRVAGQSKRKTVVLNEDRPANDGFGRKEQHGMERSLASGVPGNRLSSRGPQVDAGKPVGITPEVRKLPSSGLFGRARRKYNAQVPNAVTANSPPRARIESQISDARSPPVSMVQPERPVTISTNRPHGSRPALAGPSRLVAATASRHVAIASVQPPGFIPLVVLHSTTDPSPPERRRDGQIGYDGLLANYERCRTARGVEGLGSATSVNLKNFEEMKREKTRSRRLLAANRDKGV